jgi:histidine triad (HIT) family protein
MSQDTLFEKIVRREIPADIVYQDDDVTAFKDINPSAPVHVLVVPNKNIPTLNDASEADERILGRLLLVAARVARDAGVAETGYRVALNVGKGGGQHVWHMHLHVIGGRKLGWPPG